MENVMKAVIHFLSCKLSINFLKMLYYMTILLLLEKKIKGLASENKKSRCLRGKKEIGSSEEGRGKK